MTHLKLTFSALMLIAMTVTGSSQSARQVPMRTVYDSPATSWESEALPIGNGYMGAMVYGGVYSDVIQTNEKTLWSGGPGEDKDYDGDHVHTLLRNAMLLTTPDGTGGVYANLFDAAWADGRLTGVTITSKAGGDCTLKCPGISALLPQDTTPTVEADDRVTLHTIAGQSYHLGAMPDAIISKSCEPGDDSRVYQLNGSLAGDRPDSLGSLRPGIYIKNHQKVIVK